MLGAKYVVHIHDDLIAEVWADAGAISTKGCRDINLLESAVSRPFQTVLGGDAYPTILEKGVALFHSLVSNHPFHDGNKRTAVAALYAFLLANGWYLGVTNDEAYALAKTTASYRERGLRHEEVLADVHAKLHNRVVPISELLFGENRDSVFRGAYEAAKRMRLLIRRSPMNRLVRF